MRPQRAAAGALAVVTGLLWPPRLLAASGAASQSRVLAGYAALAITLAVLLWLADEASAARGTPPSVVLAPAAVAAASLLFLAVLPRVLDADDAVLLVVSAVILSAVALAAAVFWTGLRLRGTDVLPGWLSVLPAFALLFDVLLVFTPYAPIGPIAVSGLAWVLVGVALVATANRPTASRSGD